MVAMLPEPGRKVGKWVQMKVKVKVGKMERVRLREGMAIMDEGGDVACPVRICRW